MDKFSKSQKSDLESFFILSFLILFKLIDLDSIFSSVIFLYALFSFLVSNALIDASKGISLSRGSYLGVILDLDIATYKGSFIPLFDGRNLSKLILADTSYCNLSSLVLSDILC